MTKSPWLEDELFPLITFTAGEGQLILVCCMFICSESPPQLLAADT